MSSLPLIHPRRPKDPDALEGRLGKAKPSMVASAIPVLFLEKEGAPLAAHPRALPPFLPLPKTLTSRTPLNSKGARGFKKIHLES